MSSIKFKLTKSVAPIKLANANFAFVSKPGSVPTITSTSISLQQYSNTQQMLANDATTYANAVNYVDSKSFVNTSQLSANLSNFTNTSSLFLTTLNNVDDTAKSNNATLVYSSGEDKYFVKQIDLDGGNF